MMDTKIKLKVLLFISQKGSIVLPKTLLRPLHGFQRLRNEGLIQIRKKENWFYATVTESGREFIALKAIRDAADVR